MSYIFYDTETTGTTKGFDHILQFGAIRTNIDLTTLNQIDVRGRLMPHVLPAPAALHITGVCITDIVDPTRPSHYDMVCQIRAIIGPWCPSVFIGYNSIKFDEEFLRQAFYQCLHPLYMTNTEGSGRADALPLMRAVDILQPGLLNVPLDERGQKSFKLDRLAPANGFNHANAHDAMADVEATIHLCRIVMDGAPDLWSRFIRNAQKAAVVDLIGSEEAVALLECYPRGHFFGPVVHLGANPQQSNLRYCLDLRADFDALRNLNDGALASALSRSPKVIRRVKVNANPLIMPLYEASICHEGLTEHDCYARATAIKSDHELVERLVRACTAAETTYPPSPHVEGQIYEGGFWSDADKRRLERFHAAPWEGRLPIIGELEDQRLRTLAYRLVFMERPDLLAPAQRTWWEGETRTRLLGTSPEPGPWLTVTTAMAQLEELLPSATGTARDRLMNYRAHLVNVLQAA